jgi:hypothetical protein
MLKVTSFTSRVAAYTFFYGDQDKTKKRKRAGLKPNLLSKKTFRFLFKKTICSSRSTNFIKKSSKNEKSISDAVINQETLAGNSAVCSLPDKPKKRLIVVFRYIVHWLLVRGKYLGELQRITVVPSSRRTALGCEEACPRRPPPASFW